MSKLLQTALKELGVTEIEGKHEHNQRILEYAKNSGFEIIKDDETPWCSVFVNFCCDQLDLPGSGKANARSWLNVGKKTTDPVPGDIVIFWRESPSSWKGHVGFFLGYSKDNSKIFCLGGNQGDRVSIKGYDAAKVLGFRRVEKEIAIDIPEPVLKKGSRGEEVIKLQHLLNSLDCNCGDPDGIFGERTKEGLSIFQANNQLQVDGIYGKESRDKLESVIQSQD